CLILSLVLFFFFQAEDGIRDFHVTGVQTCALPIFEQLLAFLREGPDVHLECRTPEYLVRRIAGEAGETFVDLDVAGAVPLGDGEIGRASCRERVERWGGAVAWRNERGTEESERRLE